MEATIRQAFSEVGANACSFFLQRIKKKWKIVTYVRFTNKNHTKSCEKQGLLLSVQIIKQHYTSISIFPTIIYSSTFIPNKASSISVNNAMHGHFLFGMLPLRILCECPNCLPYFLICRGFRGAKTITDLGLLV